MKFKKFSLYLQKLEKTASRNQMTEILAEVFKNSSACEIDKICYLSLGRLAPKYEGIEFNMAEKTMLKSIAKAAAKDLKQVKQKYKNLGDLGDTVLEFKKDNGNNNNLKVNEVYSKLLTIAKEEGEGSVDRKINKMASLLKNLNPLSAKFVSRIPVNKLRLGFSDVTILDALSWMEVKDKSLRPELERGFNVLADIGKIASIFKSKGIKAVKKVKSQIGIPIRMAKAERLPNPEKILEKMDGKCALERKLDGFRVQLHLDKTRKLKLKEETNLSLFKEKKQSFVRIFSRNLDNTTYMFPDVVEAVQKLKAKKTILDGEAIAYNEKTDKFLPFQETVQRKRKHGVAKKAKQMPLKVFVFDILNLNGKNLIAEPFFKRRKILENLLKKSKGEEKAILLAEQKIVTKPKQFNKFFKSAAKEGLEGLMAKKLDTSYQAGARNYNWVKYKVAMQSDLADTIDCVVMGWYKGRGKRTSFGIGAFLAGIYNKKKDEYLTVSKIGTGLTDEQWRKMNKHLNKIKTNKKPQQYKLNKNLNPDIWCQPNLVVEIEADTITNSPIHTAKLALRFPRLKKFRDDKEPTQATTLKELKKLAKKT
jgi:DNA ligase 1